MTASLQHDWTGPGNTCNRCRQPYGLSAQCPGWADPPKPPLTFERLRIFNVARCEDSFHKLDAWIIEQWTNAMAGEAGEACNVAKKMGRGDFKTDGEKRFAVGELAKELADVVIYADLCAARMGIDLGEAVVQKFNEVSDRRSSKIKL